MHISILIVFAFLITGGIYSLFESALKNCRKTRLEKKSESRYKAVLKFLEKPAVLLISCRLCINILLISVGFFLLLFILSIAETFSSAAVIIFIFSAGAITALFTDGIPKLVSRIAPEKTTALMLPVIKALCIPVIPFSLIVNKIALFFNAKLNLEIADNSMTEDELRNALLEGEKSGIVESKERTMVEGVFYLGDRPVGAFMTHRSEIQWLDINAPYDEIRDKALLHRSQRCFPVTSGGPDEIVGAVYLEDILLDMSQEPVQGLRAIMKKPQFIPETMSALKAFESFKQSQDNFLFVMDEYGGLAGVISIRDLVEEIVGDFSAPVHEEDQLTRLKDGNFLADGTLNIDDAAKILNLTGIPEERDFHTLAGFILYLSGELPRTGDNVEYQGYKFKVVEMDGNRIGKIEINPDSTIN